jgi:hypothetical protein
VSGCDPAAFSSDQRVEWQATLQETIYAGTESVGSGERLGLGWAGGGGEYASNLWLGVFVDARCVYGVGSSMPLPAGSQG